MNPSPVSWLRRRVARTLLPRLVAGTLSAWLARWVHGAMRADAELAAAYDALRRLEGDAATKLSNGQLDLIEQMLLDGAGDGAALESDARARPRRTVALLGGGASLVAAAAVVLLVVKGAGGDGDNDPVSATIHVGDLNARGAHMAASPLGVKVACVAADGKRVLDAATAGARQSGARLDCPQGSLLAFSTTNLSMEERHLFVVGVGADGGRRYYSPFDEHGAALSMKPGVADATIEIVADTSNMPNDADVALFVLVSDAPFSAESIERQLAAAERRGLTLRSADRLPLDVPIQARIDMHAGAK